MTEEKSFAELFGAGAASPRTFKTGEKVSGTVVRIGAEAVFVDMGGKSEGYINRSELLDDQGELIVGEGDQLSAYFVGTGGDMRFSVQIGGPDTGTAMLAEAAENGIPVAGTVAAEIKGGYDVRLSGNARAFCPHSQMDLRRRGEPAAYIGERFSFLITRFSEDGRNIVLSRRRLLEQEQDEAREKLRQTLEEGMVRKGRITSVQDFGAFVEVEGVDGLIPVSEVSWGRVEDLRQILRPGDEVEVAALKLDWDNDRLSFSLKAAAPDPFGDPRFAPGTEHHGVVTSLAPFGAFVALDDGPEGLVHISALAGGRRINHPREVIAKGDEIRVRVEKIDPENRRISLVPAVMASEAETEEETVRQYLEKRPAGSSAAMGTLGDLLGAKISGGGKK